MIVDASPWSNLFCLVDALQAFFDLENANQELKSELKDLYINNAM
jgi:hypothetical protein